MYLYCANFPKEWEGFISFTTSLMLSSPLGVVLGEEMEDFETNLVIGAKKKITIT